MNNIRALWKVYDSFLFSRSRVWSGWCLCTITIWTASWLMKWASVKQSKPSPSSPTWWSTRGSTAPSSSSFLSRQYSSVCIHHSSYHTVLCHSEILLAGEQCTQSLKLPNEIISKGKTPTPLVQITIWSSNSEQRAGSPSLIEILMPVASNLTQIVFKCQVWKVYLPAGSDESKLTANTGCV